MSWRVSDVRQKRSVRNTAATTDNRYSTDKDKQASPAPATRVCRAYLSESALATGAPFVWITGSAFTRVSSSFLGRRKQEEHNHYPGAVRIIVFCKPIVCQLDTLSILAPLREYSAVVVENLRNICAGMY